MWQMSTWFDILPYDLYKFISVISTLHVVEAKGVEHFVYYSTVLEAALGKVQHLPHLLLILTYIGKAYIREAAVRCTLQVE